MPQLEPQAQTQLQQDGFQPQWIMMMQWWMMTTHPEYELSNNIDNIRNLGALAFGRADSSPSEVGAIAGH